MIERLDCTSKQEVAELENHLRNLQQQRVSVQNSFGDDLHRVIFYLAYLFSGGRWARFSAATLNFYRPTTRAVILALGIIGIIGIELLIFVPIARGLSNPAYGMTGIVFLVLGHLVLLIWLSEKIQTWKQFDDLGLDRVCAGCGYDLCGLESALGPGLWIGPKRCPECGLNYPALGEDV